VLTTTSAKIAEASITLTATSHVNVSAQVEIEANGIPDGASCVLKMEGTEIDQPVSWVETSAAGGKPQSMDLNPVGSTIFEGAGKETLPSGTHTAEVWCKKVAPAEPGTTETAKVANILVFATG
jgi:hypothetical protein